VRAVGLTVGLGAALVIMIGMGFQLTRRAGPTTAPSPGVPRDLALNRAERVSGLAYDLRLRVPASRTDPIRGVLVASFTLSQPSQGLAFDFAQPADRLHAVTVNDESTPAVVENGHIVLPADRLSAGPNTVRFEFTAGDESLNRQDEFLYSLFVPARASQAIPCLDQPDLKAQWRLSLDVPAGWTAVSNGRESGRVATADHVGYVFEETAPISTYLFAFAAGRFSVESDTRAGRTVRMFHRETDAARIARNREAIFDQHAQALAWLEDYTRIAYPFGKFDIVLIPSFQFSGMEHPGAVYYNANSLLLDATATQNQLLSRANVISHEVAHMWFGDFVTMPWFDDVWMKEVFANFMAAKIVNPAFPEMNHDLRFLTQHHPAAYDVDRTSGTNAIRQPLDNLNAAGSLYGAIIYQKAPIVMRQLERLMGETAFRDGLREYLTLHGFANASWPDLVRVLDARTPHDLEAWSQSWVGERGRPTITTELDTDSGRIKQLRLRQSDSRDRALRWTQELRVLVGRSETATEYPVTLDAESVAVPALAGQPAPDWVLPSGGGLGYGYFALDAASRRTLTERAHTIPDELTRGSAYITLWENMLEGAVPVDAMRELVLRALATESNELDLQLLLEQIGEIYWRFTRPEDRPALSTRLEPLLRSGLDRAKTTSEKGAWFAYLRSVASTPATLNWLEAVWARRQKITGLPLSEVDETELALDLAVRDVPNAERIIQQQIERTTNADRKARLSFIAPAVSRDAATRAAFFAGLSDIKNRAREAWVLDAVRYLHHPLRAETSAALVRPALDLVWEIQRTGDIFFPRRWADATLAGYQSPDVAREVTTFIDTLPPDYPPRLRWVLQSAADPLMRAAGLISLP
jgi:aminopeptidase N